MTFKIKPIIGDELEFPSALFGDSLTLEFQQSLTHTHFNGGLRGKYSLPWRECFEGQWHQLLEMVGSLVTVTITEPIWRPITRGGKYAWVDVRRHIWSVYITDESSLNDKTFDIVFMVDSHDTNDLITRSGQGYDNDRTNDITIEDDFVSRS